MKISQLIAAAMTTLALGAQAQQAPMQSTPFPERYAEFSYVPLRVSFGGIGMDVGDVGRLMLGVRPHPNMDVEAMLATGLSDIKVGGDPVLKISRSIGVFMKPGVDVGSGLRVFGRVGLIDTRLEEPGGSTAFSDRSAAFGLGISYRLSDRVSLVADYMRYADFKLVTVDGTSVGLAVRF